MNSKETAALMRKAGWTAKAFAESLNSSARIEALKSKRDPEQVTVEQAEKFLQTGDGINGDLYDTLDRWAERRRGVSNISGACFDPPQRSLTMKMVRPPVIISDDLELSTDDIRFADITNERARKKMLADGLTHSA